MDRRATSTPNTPTCECHERSTEQLACKLSAAFFCSVSTSRLACSAVALVGPVKQFPARKIWARQPYGSHCKCLKGFCSTTSPFRDFCSDRLDCPHDTVREEMLHTQQHRRWCKAPVYNVHARGKASLAEVVMCLSSITMRSHRIDFCRSIDDTALPMR